VKHITQKSLYVRAFRKISIHVALSVTATLDDEGVDLVVALRTLPNA
jgi:hypothetical protein